MGSWPGGYGLDILHPPTLDEPVDYDIVCIHGLNGTPARTWHARDTKGNTICWLSARGFLPTRFRQARIITFKYNARAIHYKSSSRLENIASSLLAQLEGQRSSHEESRRPLIFLCHSLGGLVAKQALTLRDQTPEREQIQNSTKGIIFLATPHQGSDLAWALKKLSFLMDSPKHLANVLTVGSDSLRKLTHEFEAYHKHRHKSNNTLLISSFCEMHRTYAIPYLLGATVVKPGSAKTNLPGEKPFDVPKDHRTICRFESPNDPTYELICHQIERIVSELPVRRPSAYTNEHRSQYHDIPAAKYQYLGRLEDLKWLNDTLQPELRNHAVTVALWGLNAMGKTQLSLRYAHAHLSRYRTIKRFNARTEQDLQSSIGSFFDYLIDKKDERFRSIADPNRKDKWNAVLQWFNQEPDFLLMYDYVGVEPAFDLDKYLPKSSSGHIILTSSSPNIGTFGIMREIQKMNEEEAVEMLLVRSKTPQYESQIEKERDALPIVYNLDYTPGLIEVAAKYILVNRISLKQYRERLEERKKNVELGLDRNIFDNEFDSLVLALRYLEQKPASMRLLKLFAFLDGSKIDSLLFQRARSPCLRWSKSGTVLELVPQYGSSSDPSPTLLELLQDGEAFDSAIAPLINLSFLRREPTQSGSSIEFPQMIQDLVCRSLLPEERFHWKCMAIRLVSHALPEEPNLDPEFESIRAKLSPHVFRCIENAKGYSTDQLIDFLPDIIGMLLSTVAREGYELDFLDTLVTKVNDGYYRCQAAKWRAYRDFYAGRRDEAEKILAEAQDAEEARMSQTGEPDNARAHGALGDLIMHRMQFLFMQHRFSKGEEILKRWQCHFRSTFEDRVAIHIDTAHAKMLVRKSVEEAQDALEKIVKRPLADTTGGALKKSDLNWATVILSQIYCSQGRHDDVIKLLKPQVRTLLEQHSRCEFITSDFRILLCEAYLGTKQFDVAATELKSLNEDLGLPGQVGNPRSLSQRFKVKVLRARLAHMRQDWRDAVERWIDVIGATGIRTPEQIDERKFERSEKTMVGLYSLGVARYRLGDRKRGQLYIAIAEEEPEHLKRPPGKIDYSRWMEAVRSEYHRVSRSQRNFWSC
ncbi:hypothetical protein CC78DRAFT_12869 [Lojkania enalia]|uniref:DUF676 domain-containing protein n=1 Tax=Lojkania enalia TaxID=147567 RepID=A0A9P4TR45_9PLEO|nr:hypothetical protein CC78DRAFT_12869 [Didymosphaeria enalia]